MPKPSSTDPDTRVLAGRRLVLEALERDTDISRILLQQKLQASALGRIRHIANKKGIPVQYVPRSLLEKKAGGAVHQGVVAELSDVSYRVLEEMLHEIAADPDTVRRTKPLLLLLDGIQDPHNYGALLRTAVGAGTAGIIVGTTGQAPLSSAAIKASAGAAFRIPISRVDNLVDTIKQLKERGYWVVGADGAAEDTVWSADLKRPLVLILGSEGTGIRPNVRKECDLLVAIPLAGDIDSLNVSVAGGILLFEARNSRVSPSEIRNPKSPFPKP